MCVSKPQNTGNNLHFLVALSYLKTTQNLLFLQRKLAILNPRKEVTPAEGLLCRELYSRTFPFAPSGPMVTGPGQWCHSPPCTGQEIYQEPQLQGRLTPGPGSLLSPVPAPQGPRPRPGGPVPGLQGNCNKLKSFSVQKRHTANRHGGIIKVTMSNLLNRKCATEGREVSECPWPIRESGQLCE